MKSPAESAVEESRRRDVTYWVDEKDGAFPLPWWKLLPLVLGIGVAAVAILTLIMIPVYEGKVIDNAKSELRAAGIDPDSFAFDASYRDLQIRGVLPEGVSAAEIEEAADGADGLRDLDLELAAPTPSPQPEEDEDEPAAEEPAVAETASTLVTAVVTDDGVVLSGEVPMEQQRTLLVAQAGARFGADNVTDELIVRGLDPTEPGARARTLQLGLLLSRLPDGATGTALISDFALTSDWSVASEADAEVINATVDGAQSSFAGLATATITVETPPVEQEIEALQEEFDELAVEIRENVTFATGSAVLNDTATETLDKVVALLGTYVQPVVEISGHTDDIGDDDLNLQLSDDRAAAVRQYLIDAGIDEARIQSVGRGETEPIDTNDTPEGRANNRRVELIALETFE